MSNRDYIGFMVYLVDNAFCKLVKCHTPYTSFDNDIVEIIMTFSRIQAFASLRLILEIFKKKSSLGARWRSGRASDSESRGHEFEPHRRHILCP